MALCVYFQSEGEGWDHCCCDESGCHFGLEFFKEWWELVQGRPSFGCTFFDVQGQSECLVEIDSYSSLLEVVPYVLFPELYFGEVCCWEIFPIGEVEEFGF